MPRANPPPSASPIRGDSGAEAAQRRIREWTTADEARRLPIGTKGPADSSVESLRVSPAIGTPGSGYGRFESTEGMELQGPTRVAQNRHSCPMTDPRRTHCPIDDQKCHCVSRIGSIALSVGADFCLPWCKQAVGRVNGRSRRIRRPIMEPPMTYDFLIDGYQISAASANRKNLRGLVRRRCYQLSHVTPIRDCSFAAASVPRATTGRLPRSPTSFVTASQSGRRAPGGLPNNRRRRRTA
jgi:hypothetical protein